jgi:hypothetical protein
MPQLLHAAQLIQGDGKILRFGHAGIMPAKSLERKRKIVLL